MHIGTDFANDRPHIRFRENYHGIYIGKSRENFGAFLFGHQRPAFAFQGTHGSIRIDGHNQTPAERLCRAQITHVPDVQQIEAAVGQGDGIARTAPGRNLLSQFIPGKNLF
jgi:hypothetical protein